MTNECTDYAADMTVALAYYKCLDDWHDDKNLSRKGYSAILEKQYAQVKEQWPEQCRTIEAELAALSALEKEGREDPDAASKCFGRLMEGLFLYRVDHWEEPLRKLGHGLGQYIYLADAAVDLKKDKKRGSYNPLKNLSTTPKEFRSTLTVVLGEASRAFETLPLVQDVHLLRNILYSGIWIKYNQGTREKKKVSA
jgi:hypothetical protein